MRGRQRHLVTQSTAGHGIISRTHTTNEDPNTKNYTEGGETHTRRIGEPAHDGSKSVGAQRVTYNTRGENVSRCRIVTQYAEGHTASRGGLHVDGPNRAPTSARTCTASSRSAPHTSSSPRLRQHRTLPQHLAPAEDVAHSPFMMMSASSRRSSVGSGNERPDPTKSSKQDNPTPDENSTNDVHQAPTHESRQEVKARIELQKQQIRDRQAPEEPRDGRTSKDVHALTGGDKAQQREQLRETIRIILQQIQDGVRDPDEGHDELTRLREQLLMMDKFRPLSVSTEEEPTQLDTDTPQLEGQTASDDELTRQLVVKTEQPTTTTRSQDQQTTRGANRTPTKSKNDIRMALAMAYVDQSVTTTKVTTLTTRPHDDDYSTEDAHALLTHEEQLRTNMDHINKLEDELARAASNESFGYFKIPNIPSSAHKSRLSQQPMYTSRTRSEDDTSGTRCNRETNKGQQRPW